MAALLVGDGPDGGHQLVTVGHGTLDADAFVGLLTGAHVDEVVDVRSFPGSRRHPHFAREEMSRWLPDAGVAYRWEKQLGGFRRASPDSVNTALRHPSFRGYADYMSDPAFAGALDRVVAAATKARVAVMCSESLWWRCHRRLLADAAVLWRQMPVVHLMHDGRLAPHRLTEGVRPGPEGGPPVYDVGETGRLDV